MASIDDGYDRVSIILLLDFDNNFFIQRNVQQHFYLSDLFGVMRRFQEDLFYSVDYRHQVILKHVRIY